MLAARARPLEFRLPKGITARQGVSLARETDFLRCARLGREPPGLTPMVLSFCHAIFARWLLPRNDCEHAQSHQAKKQWFHG